MGKIFYLMGKSSSGKDTIYRKILQDKSIKLLKIVPYTTRPIRAGEKQGVQYVFTDEAGFNRLLDEGKIIEFRTYDTVYGEWRYFTVADDNIDLENHSYLIIGTPEAYNSTKAYFGKEKVLPILIDLDDGVRLSRALNRERRQEVPKYEEMCRRFLADAKDFSDEKIAECGIERRFHNEDLAECISQITAYIKENM